jgi:hypothetical protein
MLRNKLAAALTVVALASPGVAWAEDQPLAVPSRRMMSLLTRRKRLDTNKSIHTYGTASW